MRRGRKEGRTGKGRIEESKKEKRTDKKKESPLPRIQRVDESLLIHVRVAEMGFESLQVTEPTPLAEIVDRLLRGVRVGGIVAATRAFNRLTLIAQSRSHA
jgi:hypothetical protein